IEVFLVVDYGLPGHDELGLSASICDKPESVIIVHRNPQTYRSRTFVPCERLQDDLINCLLIEMNLEPMLFVEIGFEHPDLVVERQYFIKNSFRRDSGLDVMIYHQIGPVRSENKRIIVGEFFPYTEDLASYRGLFFIDQLLIDFKIAGSLGVFDQALKLLPGIFNNICRNGKVA